jgi:16S rRNA (guanine1207-N2)-methyltransferase
MTDRGRSAEHYFAELPKSEAKLGLVRTRLRGKPFEFLTASSVFSKKRVDLGTRLLIEAMVLPETGCVLDVGCGYGAVGIAAAASNSRLRVIMTDVNMRAVRLARENIEINKVNNAEVRYGYFYEPIPELTFNCVLSNPPVSAGMETVKAIVRGAPRVMASKATFQMVIRSKIGGKTLPSVFNETFGNCAVLARESGYRVLVAEKQ